MKAKKGIRSFLALILALSLTLGGSAIAFADNNDSGQSVDMVVADSVYGWVTTAAAINSDGTVSVSIMPAGDSETKTYTSALSYDYICNAMTNVTYANVIRSRVGNGVFAEICLNEAGEVIDIRRVLQSGLYFDTAEFGGDLTAIGSQITSRGKDYVDRYMRFDNDDTGATGVMTGDSGRMVASGWVLEKEDGKITIGDGNLLTEVFIEDYAVADDVSVYEVNSSTYTSTPKTFADIPVTEKGEGKYEGTIYNTATRQFAIVVFDKDYTAYGDDAKVEEVYYWSSNLSFSNNGKIPQSIVINSALSTSDQGEPKPGSGNNWLTSSHPLTLVEGKMWGVGDIEVFNYLFQGDDDLILFDTGWPASGYQYWKNIEKDSQDPRDLTTLLTSPGHSDHYGTAFDGWEMIVRAGKDGPQVFETYEDTFGYDIYGFPQTGGSLSDPVFMSIITDWTHMDEWLVLSEGLAMYPYLAPGHTPGVSSAIFQVTVDEPMEGARLNSVYNEDTGEWEPVYSDFETGEEIYFSYMGGYGINGLAGLSSGYRRNAFVSSLRYLQSVVPSVPTLTGKQPDAIYNMPQHTNQFPFTESAALMEMYNEKHGTNLPFLAFLQEGNEEAINFAEKRASAILYSDYAKDWQNHSSPFFSHTVGSNIYYTFTNQQPITATSASIVGNTLEDVGPFKREAGEYTIKISEEVDILVMHGFNAAMNRHVVPAGEFFDLYDQDISEGFYSTKDAYVHDPDAWYVQIAVHVDDDYDGNVYSNQGVNEGKNFTSGPVESFHGEGWFEIVRTGKMTKEEAEALAETLKQGASYKVNMLNSGDIVNDPEDVMNTFELIGDAEDIPVTSIDLNAGSLNMLSIGKTLELNPTITPDNATDKSVTYTSNNPNVASVDEDGVVTAHKTGTALITATASSGKVSKTTVRVTY